MTYEPVTVEDLLTHQSWALRLARRLVHEDGEAEDLVQRTWMAALRHPPDSERGARAWIRKVILNLARERHRRGRTREHYERAFPRRDGDGPDTLELLSHAEIQKTLSERLLELDEPYRSVVIQRYYDGLSSVEIARRLGIPAGTVRWRLKVGLDQLRDDLDRRSGGDRSRWVSALLLFAPLGPGEPGNAAAPQREFAPALSPGLFGTTTWIALGGASLLGLMFLTGGMERRSIAADALPAGQSAAPIASGDSDQKTSVATRVERAPVAGEPGPVASALPAPDGLAILVVDRDGTPVPEARIQVASSSGFEQRATSAADGRAWLEVRPEDPGALGLPPTHGRVGVRALAPGREASALVHVAPPFTRAHGVRLMVGGRESRLTGRVLDREGRPVPGAVVAWFEAEKRLERMPEGDFASPSFLSAESDAQGAFVLANLPPGQSKFACFAPGFAYSSLVLDSPDQEPLELVLDRGARVSGTVRWPDGRPAANVSVACEPLLKAAEWVTGLPRYDADRRGFGEATRTGADGRFQLEGVKAGRERILWARDERTGLVASATRLLENERDERWDPDLAERAGFRLRLVDETSSPLAGWVVHLHCQLAGSSLWIRRRAADAEGRLLITDCPDAEAYLDVFSPVDVGTSYAWRRLKPSAEEVLVEVDTRAKSSISGCLLDTLGAPELRGRLVLKALRTTLATPLERDEQGCFEQRLAPGAYWLVLELDRTLTRLASFVLAQDERRALGTLTTPALGALRLNGSALRSNTGGTPSYSLFALAEAEEGRGFLHVARGPLEGELLLPMFPGRYRVLAFDGSGAKPSAQEFRVEAHAETRLDFGR